MKPTTWVTIVTATIALAVFVFISASWPSGEIQRDAGRFQEFLVGTGRKLVVGSGRAYVVQYVHPNERALHVFDVSDPTHPVELSRLFLGTSDNLTPVVEELVAHGNYLYSVGKGIFVTDFTEPEDPTLVTTILPEADPRLPEGAHYHFESPLISGDYLYVVWRAGYPHFRYSVTLTKISVFDISDPAFPRKVSEAANDQVDLLYDASEGLLYGKRYPRGIRHHSVTPSKPKLPKLQVFDISDPANPTLIGSIGDVEGRGAIVDAEGDLAYVYGVDEPKGPSGRASLWIFDMSDPTTPERVGWYKAPSDIRYVKAVGDRVYLSSGIKLAWRATTATSFHVLDVSTPTTPVELGSYQVPWESFRDAWWSGKFFVSGDYAHLEMWWVARVLDVSDPENIENVAAYPELELSPLGYPVGYP